MSMWNNRYFFIQLLIHEMSEAPIESGAKQSTAQLRASRLVVTYFCGQII